MKCKLVIQLSQSTSLAVTTSWWMQSEYVKDAKPQALLWKVSLSFQVQLVGVWLPVAITLPANAQNEVKQLFPWDITQSVSKIFQACQPRVERLHNYSTQDVNIHLSGHLCSARQFFVPLFSLPWYWLHPFWIPMWFPYRGMYVLLLMAQGWLLIYHVLCTPRCKRMAHGVSIWQIHSYISSVWLGWMKHGSVEEVDKISTPVSCAWCEENMYTRCSKTHHGCWVMSALSSHWLSLLSLKWNAKLAYR